jgi:hypothetical protein
MCFCCSINYVEVIVISGNNMSFICQVEDILNMISLVLRILGSLKYYLGIEMVIIFQGLVLRQRKFTLDILEEIGMQVCRPIATLIEQNHRLRVDSTREGVDVN